MPVPSSKRWRLIFALLLCVVWRAVVAFLSAAKIDIVGFVVASFSTCLVIGPNNSRIFARGRSCAIERVHTEVRKEAATRHRPLLECRDGPESWLSQGQLCAVTSVVLPPSNAVEDLDACRGAVCFVRPGLDTEKSLRSTDFKKLTEEKWKPGSVLTWKGDEEWTSQPYGMCRTIVNTTAIHLQFDGGCLS